MDQSIYNYTEQLEIMVLANIKRKPFLGGLLFFLLPMSLLAGTYFVRVSKINKEYNAEHNFNDKQIVSLRKFPYPYRAAMSISSDIDRTETLEEFLEIRKICQYQRNDKHGRGSWAGGGE